MKWVLVRYAEGTKCHEFIKNDKLEITWSEKSALMFDSFEDVEAFKKEHLLTQDYPFYILSTPTVDPIFL